jgi:RhtB (resistance to homoserine/threonine) family protein
MSHYASEIVKITLVHLLAVASPGPDFALILKQSLIYGRKTALWSALGIGTGILIHTSYSLFGLGLIIKSSPFAFEGLKWIGAVYLAYLGYKSLQAKPGQNLDTHSKFLEQGNQTQMAAWRTGFMVNILNPKCTLFFVAFFATIVSPLTPFSVRAAYGVWISLLTFIWFSLVGFIFTQQKIRSTFLKQGYWIDRALGVVFIAFAVSLVVSAIR